MSDQEILQSYCSLSAIEDCFRVLKTNFDARLVFVWTNPHIKAHFLICFVSLVIVRLIEKKIDYQLSPQLIQEALKSAQCCPLGQGYWEVFGNSDFQQLNHHLKISWERQYVLFEQLKKYADGLCIQQKTNKKNG